MTSEKKLSEEEIKGIKETMKGMKRTRQKYERLGIKQCGWPACLPHLPAQ